MYQSYELWGPEGRKYKLVRQPEAALACVTLNWPETVLLEYLGCFFSHQNHRLWFPGSSTREGFSYSKCAGNTCSWSLNKMLQEELMALFMWCSKMRLPAIGWDYKSRFRGEVCSAHSSLFHKTLAKCWVIVLLPSGSIFTAIVCKCMEGSGSAQYNRDITIRKGITTGHTVLWFLLGLAWEALEMHQGELLPSFAVSRSKLQWENFEDH